MTIFERAVKKPRVPERSERLFRKDKELHLRACRSSGHPLAAHSAEEDDDAEHDVEPVGRAVDLEDPEDIARGHRRRLQEAKDGDENDDRAHDLEPAGSLLFRLCDEEKDDADQDMKDVVSHVRAEVSRLADDRIREESEHADDEDDPSEHLCYRFFHMHMAGLSPRVFISTVPKVYKKQLPVPTLEGG